MGRVLGNRDLLLAVRGERNHLVRVGHVLGVVPERDDLVFLIEELDTGEGECSTWRVSQSTLQMGESRTYRHAEPSRQP